MTRESKIKTPTDVDLMKFHCLINGVFFLDPHVAVGKTTYVGPLL
jgi:hypothetical protein